MTRRTVLVAGGGTAGHVFPAVAVADELVRLDPTIEPVFVGTRDRLEGRLVPAAGHELHHVDVLPLPRRPSPKVLLVPGALRRSVRSVEQLARERNAVGVVTFGGYVSLPAAWAAARLQLPLVVHEQNAVPGLANRLAARWADRVAVTFPGSRHRFRRQELVVVTGNPVRPELLDLDLRALREQAREHFGLKQDLPTVFAFGGSQGSRTINRGVVGSLGRWPEPVQLLHGAGRALYDETAKALELARASTTGARASVRLVDFVDRMELAYAAADVVVCRAGATSIAELTVLGLPSLLVPYPHATADHQMANARALAAVGGALVVPDDELDGERLVAEVAPLLADRGSAARVLANAAEDFGRPDAAGNVARLVLAELGDRPSGRPPA